MLLGRDSSTTVVTTADFSVSSARLGRVKAALSQAQVDSLRVVGARVLASGSNTRVEFLRA
jgi:hypothetical protein